MPSIIWGRDPKEAYRNPYEYEAQEQFAREVESILNLFSKELMRYNRTFLVEDRSIKKAVWMLQNDAIDSLRHCLDFLKTENHKAAGKCLRDVIENLDLAAYFTADTEKSSKHLEKWYDDNIVQNSIYRDHIKRTEGNRISEAKRDFYKQISKFTHRTYRVLAYGYIRDKDDKMVYDETYESKILVPPQTIAMYYALLADFIEFLSEELSQRGLSTKEKIESIWKTSLEVDTVPRRFSPREEMLGEVVREYLKNKEHKD